MKIFVRVAALWQPDLGGKKEYECKNESCGLVINRDVNGARNNLLEKLQELIVNVVRRARRRVFQTSDSRKKESHKKSQNIYTRVRRRYQRRSLEFVRALK